MLRSAPTQPGKGSQAALVKQMSDTEAIGGHTAKEDESATSSF
jgi:hypothetical protein